MIFIFQDSPNTKDNEARDWFPSYILKKRLHPHNQTTKELCFTNRGRLGNKMFQFSAVYSLSKFYGRKLVIDHAMDKEFRILFKMKNKNNTFPYTIGTCFNLPFSQNLQRGFQELFLTIKYTNNFQIDGYFESWKYFYHDIDEIIKLFTLKEKFEKKAHNKLIKYCQSNCTSIGIQIRRGDIAKQQKEAPWSYFQQAMDYYRHKHRHVHFFVASNQLGWCRYYFRNTSDVTILTGSAYEDMAVLSECEHSIMSVGTYSWWSAMLAQGTVVYYANIDRTVHKFFHDDDFFPPHWIPMTGA